MTTKSRLVSLLGLLFPINFLVFSCLADHIGGVADISRSSSGHFFVSLHSRVTEVSSGLYTYSLCHEAVLVLHFAILAVLAVVSGAAPKKPAPGELPPGIRPGASGSDNNS